MICPLIFITLGEWIEANMFSIISMLITAVGLIVWLVRLEGVVKRLCDQVDDMEQEQIETVKDIHHHLADGDRHVNHLHIKGMERRIDQIDSRMDKMETTMSQGFHQTISRIDALLRRPE